MAYAQHAYAQHAYGFGLGTYCRELADAGFSGTIIPDLPLGEADDYLDAASGAGLDATLMVSPATPEPQLRAIAARSRGFLYVMSVMATTGNARERDDTSRWAVAARARPHSPRPVLIGFGIDTPARAAAAVRHADGVIVASALMRRVLDGATTADVAQAVADLRSAIDRPAVNLTCP
jgi:tryptophan synthase alpha chain